MQKLNEILAIDIFFPIIPLIAWSKGNHMQ